MGVLTSALFTSADPETNEKLENCATGTPTEMASHFAIGSSGDSVRRLQKSLAVYRGTHEFEMTKDGRKIGQFAINGIYSKEFADAVGVYKEIKGIKNYAGKIDKIVGIKTIRSLDKENRSNEPGPSDFPPIKPDGPFTFRIRRVNKRVFEKTSESDVGEKDSDDLIKNLGVILEDLSNRITHPMAAFGDEQLKKRTSIEIDDNKDVIFVMQTSEIAIFVSQGFGTTVFVRTETNEFLYAFGDPTPHIKHVIKSIVTEKHNNGPKIVMQDNLKTISVPRQEAKKHELYSPPKI